jgi:hypothetical protein
MGFQNLGFGLICSYLITEKLSQLSDGGIDDILVTPTYPLVSRGKHKLQH